MYPIDEAYNRFSFFASGSIHDRPPSARFAGAKVCGTAPVIATRDGDPQPAGTAADSKIVSAQRLKLERFIYLPPEG
jgi:hypothetical protein